MIITFMCPSAPHPVGGVVALYQFANGLVRRGHQVHLVHAPFFRNRIASVDDLDWFSFEPGVEHHLIDQPGDPMPAADICFGDTGDPAHGLPAVLIQGSEMLHLGLERAAFRSRALKVCIASWLVDAGQRFGVGPDQLQVVHMGIDHDAYRLLTPIDRRRPILGVLHSTHEAKGWEVAVAAIEHARGHIDDLEVRAFGTSPPPGPRPAWLTFYESPSRERLVSDLYNQSQVFLQASHYEGFGFSAVESMACGAALVTTDNGGSRDYAFDGTTALVAPPGDAEGLGDRVVTLLRDPVQRHRLAEAGRRLVAGFSWDQAAEDMEAALEAYRADPDAFRRPPGPDPGAGSRDGYSLR